MKFEERNAAWDGRAQRTFIQFHSRSGTPRVWMISVSGNQITVSHGQLNGVLQTVSEKMQGVNIGKKNEKSPEQYALERARDMSRKKNWEGYREVFPDNTPMDPIVQTDIDFENLPLSLSFYKPDNTMGAGITKKALEKKVWYSRKANGLAFIITRGTGMPKLWSRRMLRQQDDEVGSPYTWNDRFAHIALEAANFMPPNSILLGELVMIDKEGNESLAMAGSVTKTKTPEAMAFQQEHGLARFYCWDIAYWDGTELVKSAPVRERYELIHEHVEGPHFIPVQFYTGDLLPTPEAAIEYCKKAKWEGWVVVDPDGVYEDRGYNFKGKPDRPGSVCAKLKPEYEDDFIAMWQPEKKLKDLEWAGSVVIFPKAKNYPIGERSTKDRSAQGIKAVALFQYNKQGQLVYISNVSSGLEDWMKKDWAKPELFPQVWKVKYTDRRYVSQGDDTNAMDFASFLEVRTDKKPEECINPELG